jgi:hypothetical protein
VEGLAPFDTKVAPTPDDEHRRADDNASPPYGNAGETAGRRSYTDSAFTFDHRPFQ